MKKIYTILFSIMLAVLAPVTAYACEEQAIPAPENAEVEVAPEVPETPPEAADVPLFVVINPDGTETTTTDGTPATINVHRVTCTADVYNSAGQLLRTLIVSTGREGHSTPLGTYSIYEHSTGDGYHAMVDGTYGKWCMRFKKGGYMFHSVCYAKSGDPEPIQQEVDDLGTSVSRGCVRLSVADAEWLYNATPNGCVVNILDD